jgi:hypothetical protein
MKKMDEINVRRRDKEGKIKWRNGWSERRMRIRMERDETYFCYIM